MIKALLWLASLGTLAWGLFGQDGSKSWTLVAAGSQQGYLSPCGCVKPMSGGIRRRAAALKTLGEPSRRAVVELGPLSGGLGRQQELKVETLAEALNLMEVDAVSLSRTDAQLGAGVVASLQRLSGGRLVSSGVTGASGLDLKTFVVKGPFLIGSWDPRSVELARLTQGEPRSEADALGDLLAEAELQGKAAVLLLEGSQADAERIARNTEGFALILHRASSQASRTLTRIGRTALASPGEKGKAVVSLEYRNGVFTEARAVDLGPEFADDKKVTGVFQRYQGRVASEKLLDMLPRVPGPEYAGSRACISCHAEAGEAWLKSRHSEALKTLEAESSDRDPDCTGCHVVGLSSEKGFKSREATPDLADVGCESCHGAGKKHAVQPFTHKMPKVGEKSCQQCHVPDHSPGFDFKTYWSRIAH